MLRAFKISNQGVSMLRIATLAFAALFAAGAVHADTLDGRLK